MSFDAGDIDNRWICSRAAALNLQRVSTMVREIRDPCVNRSPPMVKKMLKPEKWQAFFDNEGKISGFRRALKLITMGGVDPSIRPEVWEFLLGCYSLDSNAEYRKQLRTARRERYDDLIKECQTMHSSIGTGTLAYVIGSRVMDVRNLSRDTDNREDNSTCRDDNDVMIQKVAHSDLGNNGEVLHFNQREISIDSDVTSVKGNSNFVGSEPSYDICTSDTCNCSSAYSGYEMEESNSQTGIFFDFPSLPVTNLFEKSSQDEEGWTKKHGPQSNSECKQKESPCSCPNNNSFDPKEASSTNLSCMNKSEGGTFDSVAKKRTEEKKEEFDMVRMSTSLEVGTMTTSLTREPTARKDRVSEWLWTLHRNVVDVVRTDNHLEFYEDSKNMARMSDILAVYAWVDPATGYCQGMSDLLSPFVVLYEDDADAFWCFEMLLRRLRENFLMDGPTGVMKQLQALWKILEMTDAEMFAHLSLIGAESLHFAFRMLLVLFRRELSFNDALCMWEMMWAADFDEAVARGLEANCLEPLVLQIPEDSSAARREKDIKNGKLKPETVDSDDSDVEIASSQNNGARSESSISRYPFCGLTSASFWARHEELQICTVSTSTRKADDELPVFCVAAILIINRQKIMRKTHSIDDVIKMFNDNLLKINVKRCIRMAIKLRKKYFYKIKHLNVGHSESK